MASANEKIPRLVNQLIENDLDMVVGARTGKNVKIPLIRKPAKWAIGKLANWVTGYSIPDIKEVLNMYSGDHRFKVKEDFTTIDAARIISEGNAIARFSGRMEFGARALGNRSILADPRNLTMVRELNDQIKSRDFWMPFAPLE